LDVERLKENLGRLLAVLRGVQRGLSLTHGSMRPPGIDDRQRGQSACVPDAIINKVSSR
jgi:hypothetical protein